MQRICRHMFAAIIGVFAVAGAASAQTSPPGYTPVRMAMPQATARSAAQPVANPVTPVGGLSHVRGQAGCSNCGTAGGAGAAAAPATPGVPYAHFGPRDRNGCGSCQSDLGFIFGSCKSFFSPCGPRPCDDRSGGGLFHRNCGVHPFAAPYGNGYNGCAYDSYLNH